MKTLKKLVALLMAVAMLSALCVSASAATITVAKPADDATTGQTFGHENYDAYKIFDAVKASGTIVKTTTTYTAENVSDAASPQTAEGAIAYQISTTSDWFAVLFDPSTATPVTGQKWVTATATGNPTVYQIHNTTADFTTQSDAIAFADWLLANKGPISADYSALAEGATTVADGYYLITSSRGTNLGLATSDIPMNIVEKNVFPTIDKTVDPADEVAQIGQPVTYTVTVTVPSTAKQAITVEDTMSAGLSFVSLVSVQNNDSTPANVTYTSTPNIIDAANVTRSFTIVFDAETVKSQQGKNIVITYSAKLNKDAVVSAANTTGNKNTVVLSYDSYYQTKAVDVNTVAVSLLKYDGADVSKASLAGAQFELHDSNGAIGLIPETDDTTTTLGTTYQSYHIWDGIEAGTRTYTITTTANKQIRVKGIDSDKTDYKWVEVKAPEGYNLLQAEKTITVDKNDVINKMEVANNQGTILPSTGGIGTTIFYVVGIALALGAAVILVARRKADSEK